MYSCVQDNGECLCYLEKSILFSFTCQYVMTFLYNFWCKNRKEKLIECNILIHTPSYIWKYLPDCLGHKSGILNHACKMVFFLFFFKLHYELYMYNSFILFWNILFLYCFSRSQFLMLYLDYGHLASLFVFLYAWLHLTLTGHTKINTKVMNLFLLLFGSWSEYSARHQDPGACSAFKIRSFLDGYITAQLLKSVWFFCIVVLCAFPNWFKLSVYWHIDIPLL